MSKTKDKTGIDLIKEERERQISVEGFDGHRDSRWYDGELAIAASCYCLIPGRRESRVRDQWALDYEFWKPTPDDRIRELQKAGALIAAEIDRLINLHKKDNKNSED